MCQIVITEKSVPKDIAGWLDSAEHPNKEVVVMGDPNDEIVRECVTLAEARKLPVHALDH